MCMNITTTRVMHFESCVSFLSKNWAREGNWTHNHHINWVQLLAFRAQTNWDKIYVFVDNSYVKCLSFLAFFLKASRILRAQVRYRLLESRFSPLYYMPGLYSCIAQKQWNTIAANPPQRGWVSAAFSPALMHRWEHKRRDSIIESFVL